MAAQASACAVVGAAKVLLNHSRVTALNRRNGSGDPGSDGLDPARVLTSPWCQPALTNPRQGPAGSKPRGGHGLGQFAWNLGHPGNGVEQRVRARVGEPV